MGVPGGSVVKNSPASSGDAGSISGLGRFPAGENSNLLWYFCRDNPTVREAWQATVHEVPKVRHD